MKILVTGAAGFIGSHLAERLAETGHDVLGLDCFTDYYDVSIKRRNAEDVGRKGVEVAELDLACDDIDAVTAEAEVVYHLAAQPGISGSVAFDTYLRNNVTATYRLLESLKKAKKLKLFVNAATSSVYGSHATDSEEAAPKPTSYYGVTKLAAEQLAMAYHRQGIMPICSLRLFSVYGPRERPEKLFSKLIGSLINDEPFTLCEGSREHLRSYTYIDDIIDGMVKVLDRQDACGGEIFNLGWEKDQSTGEAIELAEKITGKKVKIEIIPPRPGDQSTTAANINKARKLLGYNPQTDLRTGIEKTVEWFKL